MKRTAFILVTAALIFACLPALAEVENTDSATRTKSGNRGKNAESDRQRLSRNSLQE